jgi:hypothetical protein
METQTGSILPVRSNVGSSSIALEPQTYSVADAAQVLGISEVTVYPPGRAVDQSNSGSQFPLAAFFEMSVLGTFHLTGQARTLMGVSITVILEFFARGYNRWV